MDPEQSGASRPTRAEEENPGAEGARGARRQEARKARGARAAARQRGAPRVGGCDSSEAHPAAQAAKIIVGARPRPARRSERGRSHGHLSRTSCTTSTRERGATVRGSLTAHRRAVPTRTAPPVGEDEEAHDNASHDQTPGPSSSGQGSPSNNMYDVNAKVREFQPSPRRQEFPQARTRWPV